MKVISKQRTFSICRQKDPGFHGKWNRWDQFWPGVAPCKGQKKKNRQNWQRQKIVFSNGARKIAISRSIFIVKTT